MAAVPANSQTSAWTEPPWSGWIETTGDALLILEAARRGLIPRVTRRLIDAERKMITSGSVFVFDEDESGIKRWTDGFYWSPSRILGNFLLYRETDKRGAGHRGAKGDSSPTEANEATDKLDSLLTRPKTENGQVGDLRPLMGSLTNSYKFKPDGLMKKTFSLTIDGVSQHLISYYKVEDVTNGRLRSPSSLPELASLDISPQYLDKTHFRNPPKVEIGMDGIPRYRGEADDIDTSPALLTAPLSAVPLAHPVRTPGPPTNRRPERFGPYKRRRQQTRSSPEDTPVSPSVEQTTEAPTATPAPSYSGAPAAVSPLPPPHPTPYPVPSNYYPPPYIPHVFYSPGTTSPAPLMQPPYALPPVPAAEAHPPAAPHEVVPQPYYPYSLPPQVAGYPPGYNPWGYGTYPAHAPTGLPAPQSSSANINEHPTGNNLAQGGSETPE